MQFRIGDRDPVTGLYNVIWPDGSKLLNGIKIFNAAHQTGDVVVAVQRSDGMTLLDSAKAVDPPTIGAGAANSITDFNPEPITYLRGQVFNIPDDDLPNLSIDFAPASSHVLDRYTGYFTVRVSLDRARNRDTKFRIDLGGDAINLTDYSTSIDPAIDIVIPSGYLYLDIAVVPIYGEVDYDRHIILSLQPSSKYRIVKPSVDLKLVPINFKYRIYRRAASLTSSTYGSWSFVETVAILTPATRATYQANWLTTTLDVPLPAYVSYYNFKAGENTNPAYVDPAFPALHMIGVDYAAADFNVETFPRQAFYRGDVYIPLP